MASLLGLSIPMHQVLTACSKDDNNTGSPTSFEGSVLIIGAGAAGMAAGHLLAQQGISFQILEAAPTYGGRIKHTRDFADFPISLGGEWLHVAESNLTQIVNDPSVNITTQMKKYEGTDIAGHYENGQLQLLPLSATGDDLVDSKFVGSSWLDFFETYILPSVQQYMQFDTIVQSIDYSGDQVVVTDSHGYTYAADKLILTVPIKQLQLGAINFNPALPDRHQDALEDANIWSGLKVFMEFSQKFYPVYLSMADSFSNQGQKLYYDASYGQNSNAHILGLFSVGQQAEVYQQYSGDDLRDYILAELDPIFNNQASATFVKYIVQNWNEEPFIGAAYMADNQSWLTSRRLAKSISDKVYFAGCSYTRFDDWSSVHTAAQSARDAVSEILVS